MSKELTPLEAWEEVKDEMLEWTEGYEENFNIIEITLKEYEELKNMFPLEETSIRNLLITLVNLGITDSDTLLKKIKALEIIKRKPQTLSIIFWTNNYEDYFEVANDQSLIENIYTKEEYELLKEILI